MNSIERGYADYDSGWILLNKSARQEIVKMTMLYLVRAVTSHVYSEKVRTLTGWTGRQMSGFRTELKFNGYLQRDFKFYLYECVVNGTYSLSSMLLKEDRAFIQRFVKAEDDYQKALVKQCRAFKKLGYPAQPLSQFKRSCENIVPELMTYCRKFVIKSLRFVVRSEAMTIDDMVQELVAYGVYAIYRSYPECMSELHLLNIAKQAAHNRGENIIKEATTQSRSKLGRNADGTFFAKVISLDSGKGGSSLPADFGMLGQSGPVSGGVMVCTALMAGLDGQAAEGETVLDVDRKRDLKAAVQALHKSLSSEKARRFLELLMGVHDLAFSTWLGQENDEMFERVDRKVYAEKVREYLNVPVERARKFVSGLRSELIDFRN